MHTIPNHYKLKQQNAAPKRHFGTQSNDTIPNYHQTRTNPKCTALSRNSVEFLISHLKAVQSTINLY